MAREHGPITHRPLSRSRARLEEEIVFLEQSKKRLETRAAAGLVTDARARIEEYRREIAARRAALHQLPPARAGSQPRPPRLKRLPLDPAAAEVDADMKRLAETPFFRRAGEQALLLMALDVPSKQPAKLVEVPDDVRQFAQYLVSPTLFCAFAPKAPEYAIELLRALMAAQERHGKDRWSRRWFGTLERLFAKYPESFPSEPRTQVGFIYNFLRINHPELRVRLSLTAITTFDLAHKAMMLIGQKGKRGRPLGPRGMASLVARAFLLPMPTDARKRPERKRTDRARGI